VNLETTALDLDTIAGLRAAGFEGFVRVRDLRRDDALAVPKENGVYVMVRETPDPPCFLPRGTGAVWRGQDPNVKAEVLESAWVPGSIVLYVGRAAGTGVRGKLQQRVKRWLRFGQGRSVAHRGGRYVWQLADAYELPVAWKACADAAGEEAALLAAFEAAHRTLPFANLRQEAGNEEREEA